MNAASLILLVVCSVGMADDPPKDAQKQALEKLQGSWQLVSAEIRGRKVVIDAGTNTDRTVIDGEKVTVMRGGRESHSSTIRIDPSKSPGHMDSTHVVRNGVKTVSEGIYKLEGDTLTICASISGEKRPERFESNEKVMLSVLKRVGQVPPKPAGP